MTLTPFIPKDKSIGFADNQQHYDGCLVNTMKAVSLVALIVSLISWEKDNLMLFWPR